MRPNSVNTNFVVVLLLFIGFLAPAELASQATGQVSGRVSATDTGQPIAGVVVLVVDQDLGALTGLNGQYLIENVPAGRYTLRAQSIGYASRDVPVQVEAGTLAVADILLEPRPIDLEELVVVGYGRQRRSEITGAIASVTADEFVAGPAVDAGSLIAGQLSGLVVNTPSGDPRASTEIYLRGITTIRGDRSPLVLIDGVPGSLNTVAPQDIDAISVLKDGSAAAIYGSRAQNGVVLITTKRHQGESATIRYEGYVTQQRIANRPDFLTSADYRRLIAEGMPFQDLGHDTDWIGAMLREPISHVHNLTLTGGGHRTNYTASVSHENNQGIVIRSDEQQSTARLNIRHMMWDDLLQAEVNLLNRTRTYFTGPSYPTSWRFALIRNPTDRVRDDNGDWQERADYDYLNPLSLVNEHSGEYEGRTSRIHGTLTLQPLDNLSFSLMTGTSTSSSLSGHARTLNHNFAKTAGRMGTASRSASSSEAKILELTGTYLNSFERHNFNMVGGYSYQDSEWESFSASNEDFPTDLFTYHRLQTGAALGEGRADMSSSKSGWRLIGLFGRLNYDWDSRFLLMASLRREGDSRFGAGHQWGLFPGVSAGWRLSRESFVQDNLPWVDDLRVRVGYGVTGVAPTEPYLSLTSYSYSGRFPYDGRWIQGLAPSRNPNPNLRWEEKREVNVGLNLALFDSRLSGSLDVYRRNTHDLLYNYTVPVPPNLTTTLLANVGTMRNEGIELELRYDVINRPGLRWTTSSNWSTTKNRLVTLSDDVYTGADFFTQGHTGAPIQTYTHRVDMGGPIGNFFGWKVVDLDEDGQWIVETPEGELISVRDAAEGDKRVLGNGIPRHFLGWTNRVQAGRFYASVMMRGAFGFQNLNFLRMYYENPTITMYNMLQSAFDPVFGKGQLKYEQAMVSYYVEDGDYWKIDNVTLGYTLGPDQLGWVGNLASTARIYVTGRNLLTITGYKGLDPEVPFAGNPFTAGNDNRESYPTTRSFSAGMTVTF